jgi:hypothetical protein
MWVVIPGMLYDPGFSDYIDEKLTLMEELVETK